MDLVKITPLESKLEFYSPFLKVAILFFNFLGTLQFFKVEKLKFGFSASKYII